MITFKKSIVLALSLLATISVSGQNLSLRIANQHISNDSLVFDIQGKTTTGNEYLQDFSFYLDYSSAAFGTNVVAANNLSTEFLTLFDGIEILTSGPKYTVINSTDNTSTRFSIVVNASISTSQGSPGAHNQFTSSYQGMLRVRIYISDNTALPRISFNNGLMANDQFYLDASSADNVFSLTVENDLNVYPLDIYDIIWDGIVWSGGNDPSGAPNTSNTVDDLLVEQGTTDPLPGNATVNNLIILDGGTLDLGGNTLSVTGSILGSVSGSVTNGTIRYAGSAAQQIVGGTSWENIEIDNASGVTVESGRQEITGVLTPSSGTFTTNDLVTIKATDSENYGQIAPGSGTVSGNVTFQMYIDQAGWHNLASPIASMTLADLEDDITINYTSNPNGVSAYQWNASTGNWVDATANTDAFTGGWNIYISNDFVPADSGVNNDGNLPVILDLTGTINTGSQTATIGYTDAPGWSTFTNTNGTSTSGWNLIANPYPSNLDWAQVAKDMSGSSINGYYYIWDPASGSYVYHNEATGSSGRSTTVAPMQAIWVKLDDAGETSTTVFDFVDADRTVSTPAAHLKSSEFLRLNIAQAGQVEDRIAFFRELGRDLAYEPLHDAIKQINPGKANLYFLTEDSIALALNSINRSYWGDTLMMGLSADHGVVYTIGITENALPADFTHKLVDLKTGAIHDLGTGNYTFTHDTAFSEHRFNLMSVSKNIGTEEEEAFHAFNVRVTNGELDLQFGDAISGPVDIEIIDLAGRVLYSEENVPTYSGRHQVNFSSPLREVSMYILRLREIETENTYAEKFLF